MLICFLFFCYKKHLFLLHRIKRPDPDEYCEDLANAAAVAKSTSSSAGSDQLVIDEAADDDEEDLNSDLGYVLRWVGQPEIVRQNTRHTRSRKFMFAFTAAARVSVRAREHLGRHQRAL